MQVRANIAKNRVEITFVLRIEGKNRSSSPIDIRGFRGMRIEHFDEIDIKNDLLEQSNTVSSGYTDLFGTTNCWKKRNHSSSLKSLNLLGAASTKAEHQN